MALVSKMGPVHKCLPYPKRVSVQPFQGLIVGSTLAATNEAKRMQNFIKNSIYLTPEDDICALLASRIRNARQFILKKRHPSPGVTHIQKAIQGPLDTYPKKPGNRGMAR